MKLIIKNEQLQTPPEIFLRNAGYSFITSRQSGDDSFVRCLSRNFYPRFHVYIERQDDQVIFNLHLDQKKPMYPGQHAHNAEYDGDVVEGEMKRIKGLLM